MVVGIEDMDTDWWERLLRNKAQIVIARCRPIHRQTLCLNLKRLDFTVALTGIPRTFLTIAATPYIARKLGWRPKKVYCVLSRNLVDRG